MHVLVSQLDRQGCRPATPARRLGWGIHVLMGPGHCGLLREGIWNHGKKDYLENTLQVRNDFCGISTEITCKEVKGLRLSNFKDRNWMTFLDKTNAPAHTEDWSWAS